MNLAEFSLVFGIVCLCIGVLCVVILVIAHAFFPESYRHGNVDDAFRDTKQYPPPPYPAPEPPRSYEEHIR